VERRDRDRIGDKETLEDKFKLGQTAQMYPIRIIIAPK